MRFYVDSHYAMYLRYQILDNLLDHVDSPTALRDFLTDPTAYVRKYSELLLAQFQNDNKQEEMCFIYDKNGDGILSEDEVLIDVEEDQVLTQSDYSAIGIFIKDNLKEAIRAQRRGIPIDRSEIHDVKSSFKLQGVRGLVNSFGEKLLGKETQVVKTKHKAKVMSIFNQK